jgi:hypothetical protein
MQWHSVVYFKFKKALETRLCIVEFEYPGKGFMQMLHLLLEKVSLVYYANLSSNISLQAGSHLPHELIVCNVFSLSKGGTVRVLFWEQVQQYRMHNRATNISKLGTELCRVHLNISLSDSSSGFSLFCIYSVEVRNLLSQLLGLISFLSQKI